MLSMGMSNFNFNANSTVEVENTDGTKSKVSVANFTGSYSGDQIYMNYNIMNKKEYAAHEEEIDADFAEFKTNVFNAIENLK